MGFGLVTGFIGLINTQLVTTLYSSLQHALSFLSLLCLHQSLPGYGLLTRVIPHALMAQELQIHYVIFGE
jgi:hypothetical protein